jgi:hypothetical protein
MADTFPTTDRLEDGNEFVRFTRRMEYRDRLSDYLVRRVSKDLFSRSIPTCDDATETLANNCIFARLNYCGEELNCLIVIPM